MIQLVGPGGAGKTTVGAALAERLGERFVDLDAEFAARHGEISTYLDRHGYEIFTMQPVATVVAELVASVRASPQ
jgi:shikimate kinase